MGIEVPASLDGGEIGISEGFSGACVDACEAIYSTDGAVVLVVVVRAGVDVTISVGKKVQLRLIAFNAIIFVSPSFMKS